jgi:hypothetical protein
MQIRQDRGQSEYLAESSQTIKIEPSLYYLVNESTLSVPDTRLHRYSTIVIPYPEVSSPVIV